METIQEPVLIEAILHAREQVDFIWQFFVTVHIAVFALLFIYDDAVDRLSPFARIFAIVGIGLFDFINGQALINAYQMLDAMMDQYRVSYGQIERFQPLFYERFVLLEYAHRPNIVKVTHSLALIVVVVALFARHLMQSRGDDAARSPTVQDG